MYLCTQLCTFIFRDVCVFVCVYAQAHPQIYVWAYCICMILVHCDCTHLLMHQCPVHEPFPNRNPIKFYTVDNLNDKSENLLTELPLRSFRTTTRSLCPSLQAWSFLSHLPVLEVSLSVKGWWEKSQEQTERPLPAAGANRLDESSWLDVHADQEYVLQVSLRRITQGQQRVSARAAFFFPISHRCAALSMHVVRRKEIDLKAPAVVAEGNDESLSATCRSESSLLQIDWLMLIFSDWL